MAASPPRRPKEIVIGITLLGMPLGTTFLALLMNAIGIGNMEHPLEMKWLVFFTAPLAVEILFVWFAYLGRNWARILAAFLAVLTLTTIETWQEFLYAYDFHPLVALSMGTAAVAPLGAVSLFLPRANAWFAEMGRPRAAA